MLSLHLMDHLQTSVTDSWRRLQISQSFLDHNSFNFKLKELQHCINCFYENFLLKWHFNGWVVTSIPTFCTFVRMIWKGWYANMPRRKSAIFYLYKRPLNYDDNAHRARLYFPFKLNGATTIPVCSCTPRCRFAWYLVAVLVCPCFRELPALLGCSEDEIAIFNIR